MTEAQNPNPEALEKFKTTLAYVSQGVRQLADGICGLDVEVPILKLFARDEEDYAALRKLVESEGIQSPISSDNSFYVEVNSGLTISDTPITLLGVRRPDPKKPYIGCGDFFVDDLPAFIEKITAENQECAKPVYNAHGTAMLELSHSDIDVLGYVIQSE